MTPHLLRGWAESGNPNRSEIFAAVKLIETRASFCPRSRDPDVDWWMSQRGTESQP